MRTDWLNVSMLSTIFGKPLALVVPNMVLSKLNIQKLVSQHTRGRYTFQPLWVSGPISWIETTTQLVKYSLNYCEKKAAPL